MQRLEGETRDRIKNTCLYWAPQEPVVYGIGSPSCLRKVFLMRRRVAVLLI